MNNLYVLLKWIWQIMQNNMKTYEIKILYTR